MKQELINLLRKSTKYNLIKLYKVCNEDSILKEYELIKDKKSHLSRSERNEIIALVKVSEQLEILKENGTSRE